MSYLFDLGVLFAGVAFGFMLAALLTNNKIEEAYQHGFNRGRLISTNSVNDV